jgi:hypothetical protein
MATILTVTDLALRLDTDARTTRKFLRTITPIDAQPGKGSRWAIEARQVQSLKSKFKKFADDAAKDAAAPEVVLDHDGLDTANEASDTQDA